MRTLRGPDLLADFVTRPLSTLDTKFKRARYPSGAPISNPLDARTMG